MTRIVSKKRTIKIPEVSGEIPRDDLKMVVNGVHVSSESGTWRVQKSGGKRVSTQFTTQADAVAHARELAAKKGRLVVVHGRNGRIRRIDSYAKD